MADALLRFVLEKLSSFIQKKIGLIWGVDKEMKKLSSLFSTIQDVLEDAEEKQIKDKALQNWLRKLKDAAYKVDDILDECEIEVARLESYSCMVKKVHTSFLNYLCPHDVLFRSKIGSKMEDIRDRLEEIAQERLKFHLPLRVSEKRSDVIENRQTSSILTQSQVYGRDQDKRRIVEFLVEKVNGFDGVSVYAIVGLGGLGKTTLAQMVFNDERIRNHFELRILVCVSEDFNMKRITKEIIESATGFTCPDLNLDLLQRRLQEKLNGKRHLLVLDDVWNEDEEKWDRLKNVLACGSRGSSIIVTTRIKMVASIMATMPLHQLSCLTDDDCWSLFRECAFRHETKESQKLVKIGKKIVKKCGGVPLAVKTLGSMMSYKSEENQWLLVLESELWNILKHESSILPALQLSYFNLPLKLRPLFAYCAMFPKDFVIEKELLIQLWMASGFIPLTEMPNPEVIGNEICNDLYWRSFLQDPKEDDFGNITGFKMHDLVHDLAQSIMKDECLTKMIISSTSISERTSHFAVVNEEMSGCSFPEALYQVETLRTFLMHKTYGSFYEISCDFSRLSSLRVLGARGAKFMKLSSSISNLKHLRYLDLSHSDIQMLPESICILYNLQTLRLKNCYYLQKLPKHIKRLKNLRHFYLDGCKKVSQMPPQIGQISCLKTLTCFIVGKEKGCHLDELKDLNLGGTLRIKHLQRVKNPLDAKEANLVEKLNLRQLYLSWDDDSDHQSLEDVEKVLEALKPPTNLKRLDISMYKGTNLSFWMKIAMFLIMLLLLRSQIVTTALNSLL